MKKLVKNLDFSLIIIYLQVKLILYSNNFIFILEIIFNFN